MNAQWIPLYLIVGYVSFRFLLQAFYPIFVFIHELAHAIPGKILYKTEVSIHIGDGPVVFTPRLPGIKVIIHRHDRHTGTTRYQTTNTSTLPSSICILIAPLLSLAITIAGGWWIFRTSQTLSLISLMILTSAWLANFHITFNAWWPFSNDKSDLQAFFSLFRKKN